MTVQDLSSRNLNPSPLKVRKTLKTANARRSDPDSPKCRLLLKIQQAPLIENP